MDILAPLTGYLLVTGFVFFIGYEEMKCSCNTKDKLWARVALFSWAWPVLLATGIGWLIAKGFEAFFGLFTGMPRFVRDIWDRAEIGNTKEKK